MQMPVLKDLPLEDGRLGLLKWIDQTRPQGSVNNRVTIVFDGHPGHFGPTATLPGRVAVIFSEGCSADDTIKRMVEKMPHKKNCVVVSDDKDVFLYARSLGAKVMKVAAFVSKARGHGAPGDSVGKYISLSRQEKINQEFQKIWLKEK
jgi:predicted RNA-binding protein with PIN domain